jgi:hypothetical protein
MDMGETSNKFSPEGTAETLDETMAHLGAAAGIWQ